MKCIIKLGLKDEVLYLSIFGGMMVGLGEILLVIVLMCSIEVCFVVWGVVVMEKSLVVEM